MTARVGRRIAALVALALLVTGCGGVDDDVPTLATDPVPSRSVTSVPGPAPSGGSGGGDTPEASAEAEEGTPSSTPSDAEISVAEQGDRAAVYHACLIEADLPAKAWPQGEGAT